MPRDTLDEVSDETLLVLYANGDPSAARVLTTRLSPRVLGYATRLWPTAPKPRMSRKRR